MIVEELMRLLSNVFVLILQNQFKDTKLTTVISLVRPVKLHLLFPLNRISGKVRSI